MCAKSAVRKPDVATVLAQQFVEQLKTLKAEGASNYPTTLRRLIESAGMDHPDAELVKALGKPAFKDVAFLVKAPSGKTFTLQPAMDSPAALQEDFELVARSPATLAFVLRHKANATNTVRKGWVSKTPPAFAKFFGEVLDETTGPDALARRFVSHLRGHRPSEASVLLTLRGLVEAVDPNASNAAIAAALATATFKDVAFLVKAPSGKTFTLQQAMDSPAALQEDFELVARSPATLAFVLRHKVNATNTVRKGWVSKTPPGFAIVFGEVLDENTGPSALASKLIKVLETQRRLGGSHYPLTLEKLAELADLAAMDEVLQAVIEPKFSQRAMVLTPGAKPSQGKSKKVRPTAAKPGMDCYVILAEDADHVAASGWLLDYALRTSRDSENDAFDVVELATKRFGGTQGKFAAIFARKVTEQMDAGTTPRSVAWVRAGGRRLVFLTEHLAPSGVRPQSSGLQAAALASPATSEQSYHSSTVTPVPPSGIAGSGAESFAARFDEEFIRLDRLHGSHNFVWLSDLRRSLSEFSREQFDGGVNKLREARRYQLNAAEGRSGTSSEQLEASIVEIGVRYIAISRLRP